MYRSLAACAILFAAAVACSAIPITAFVDVDTFVERAQHIIVAKCVGPVHNAEEADDGLYAVHVDMIAVVKGPKNPDMKLGKTRIATIYPMETGKRYLLMNMGGSTLGTNFHAIPELSVVELPPNFQLDALKGKSMADQVRTVFAARRHEIERQQRLLKQEKALLDQAIDK
jgi:hypothetical protein